VATHLAATLEAAIHGHPEPEPAAADVQVVHRASA
jgi:hypothetical protein